jgi:uncharacterized protein YcbX
MSSIHVASLHLYPVKGCAGLTVDQLTFDRWGPIGDRRWLVVDPDGRFITQRETPGLVLIRPTLIPGGLRLTMPDSRAIELATPTDSSLERPATIWRDTVNVVDAGDEAASLLSDALGRPVRLVAAGPRFDRQVELSFAEPGDQVGFADAYPLLVIGEESLAELNRRGEMALPMTRFRPNIVVSGTAPFEEDSWVRARFGSAELDLPKPCARCAVTTVDPETGTFAGKEPLRTLSTFRRGAEGAVLFGMNAIPRAGLTIRRGDPVQPLHTR